MAPVLNLPVGLDECQELSRGSHVWGQTGQTTDRIVVGFAVAHAASLQEKDLCHITPLVGKRQIEFGAGVYLACDAAAMAFLLGGGRVHRIDGIGRQGEEIADIGL